MNKQSVAEKVSANTKSLNQKVYKTPSQELRAVKEDFLREEAKFKRSNTKTNGAFALAVAAFNHKSIKEKIQEDKSSSS